LHVSINETSFSLLFSKLSKFCIQIYSLGLGFTFGVYVWGLRLGFTLGVYVWGLRLGFTFGVYVWGLRLGLRLRFTFEV